MRQISTEPTGAPTEAEARFTAFYAAHYPRVLAWGRRRADEESAREVAAETFTVAWRRCDVALQRGLPWLYATAAMVLRNHHRSQRRAADGMERLIALPPPSSADHAQAHAEREVVRDAVRALPEADRELLMLTVWEQLDVRTAATVVGCSTTAAHVRLHRARRRLRVLLEPSPPAPAPTDPPAPSRKDA